MIRIGKLADYALLVTNHLVKSPDTLCTTEDLAKATGLPLATVRKLLKKLVDGDVIQSYRGIHGGYRLGVSADSVSVADVIRAVEGPIAITECAHHDNTCGLATNCDLKDNWSYVNRVVHMVLEHITLADMAQNAADQSIQLPKAWNQILNSNTG